MNEAALAVSGSPGAAVRTPARGFAAGCPAGAAMPDLRARLTAALAVPAGETSDFDGHGGIPAGLGARAAGVLAAFLPDGRLILTQRASGLRQHAGQIALPGGKVDPGDAGPIGAALREAQEEVGLPTDQVEVLGTMPPHRTVTGYAMTPVLALVHGDFVPAAEPGEVAAVFCLPFAHVADPASYRLERRRWRGEWRSYHAAPWGPWYLWGTTARVLRALALRLAA